MKFKIFSEYIFSILFLGSMQPVFNENDIVIVKKCKIEELHENDIITFKQEEKIISHRIIEIREKGIYTTKGDNNEIKDSEQIHFEQVYGKVLFKIPKIGKPVQYLQNEKGFIKVTILILIIFILFNLRDNKKNNRKIVRKKYEVKKLRDKYNF